MNQSSRQHVIELADRYGRLVYSTAHRILGNTHDAEDVLQQVFLKLLGVGNGHVAHQPVQDWGAYLRTMASRTALDVLRTIRQRRRREMPLTEGVLEEQEVAETTDSSERADRLRQAIAILPERDAWVFSLRYFEELSYESIATETGLSIDLIGVILHRSRKTLREAVEQLDVQERSNESW
jgi:RNA polymerase sigma-70 factor, ECF subfamily